jgi:hypothetical protein
VGPLLGGLGLHGGGLEVAAAAVVSEAQAPAVVQAGLTNLDCAATHLRATNGKGGGGRIVEGMH